MVVAFPEVRVGAAVGYESLSVFPLFTGAGSDVEYILSDEAMRENALTVSEISDSGSVPELLVENTGDARVLFIEGEQLVGAKQNRILNTSILVPARSRMKIPVSCVEQGRWRHTSPHFAPSAAHSPSKLRRALKASVTGSVLSGAGYRSDQGRVWDEVALFCHAHDVQSPTGAMADAFDAYEGRLAECRDKLRYVSGASGMAVAIGDKIVGYDLFDKPATCEKVWSRMLSGVIFDALTAKDAGKPPEPAAIEAMLKTTREARWQPAEPLGEGEEYRAQTKRGDHASALIFRDALVHGSAVMAG